MSEAPVSPGEFARAVAKSSMMRDVVLDWDDDGAYVEATLVSTGQRYKIRPKGMVGRVA